MEGEDLRFRLDWPEAELPAPKSEDELTDFSFEWDEQPVELTLAQTAEPQPSDFVDPAEHALDVEEPPIAEAAPQTEFAPVEEVYDAPFYDETDTLDTVRRVLNEHNDALVQLSDAVAQLASNVRVLIEQPAAQPAPTVTEDTAAVTASAMLTVSAEVSGAIEQLTERFEAMRVDLHGLMDDVVAAATNPGGNDTTRITVELERLRSEVQALKRRLPVRARELDAGEIAERVAETVLAALAAQPAPEPAPRRRRPAAIAEPDLDIPVRPLRTRAPQTAKAQPAKARPVRRRAADDESHEGADYPVATAKRASRQRPLRAD
jgi:hypothetical protein